MGFLILLILLALLLFGLLGWSRWRDSGFLKKKTRDVMDQSFRETIDHESEETRRKRRKFQASLKRHGY